MKLLFFTYDFPYPLTSGGKNRAYHMLKYGGKGIDIILFSFYREIPDQVSIAELEKLGIEKMRLFQRKHTNFRETATNPRTILQTLPQNTHLLNPATSITKKLYFQKDILEELIKTVKKEKIDVVHFESLYTSYYISDKLKDLGVVQVFGTENIESNLYKDYARSSAKKYMKPLYQFEAHKIQRDEEFLLKAADHCLAVSQDDADAVTQVTNRETEIIANGVDLEMFSFQKKRPNKNTLLFVGNFTYFPNVEAIEKFYHSVFAQIDNAVLRVIGKNASQLPIDDSRVEKIEFVPDIRTEYYNADIFVFPITIGGGTNFKVIEAMACGTPIIAYGDRVKAMGVGKDEMVIVDTPKNFEQAIHDMLNKKTDTESLVKNARAFVEKNYSWETIGEKLNRFWIGLKPQRAEGDRLLDRRGRTGSAKQGKEIVGRRDMGV